MVDFALLNELSLPFNSYEESQNGFIEFFKVIKKLKKNNIDKIRVDKEVKSFEILNSIYFPQYLGQIRDKEFRDRLRAFITNRTILIDSPFVNDDEDGSGVLLENEYFYKNNSTQGALAVADIWDSIVVSFNSNSSWNSAFIVVEKENISGYKESLNIRNITVISHFDVHKDFFNRLYKFVLSDIKPTNFWEKRDTIFSNKVVFCDSIKDQVKSIDYKIFKQAIMILQSIENGVKTLDNLIISGEGESVKTNPRLKSYREFMVDGKKEFFDKHIKNLPNGYRIYYLEKYNKLYIGYIGKHLPSKNF